MSFRASISDLKTVDATARPRRGATSPSPEIDMHVSRDPLNSRRTLLPGLVAAGLFAVANVGAASPQPVLMVLANQDFHYAEYASLRASLEARGYAVVVAAGDARLATPQRDVPGQAVVPDLALAKVSAGDYSAIAFVGGWGASQYQYAFDGSYDAPAYRPQKAVTQEVNRLINDFIEQDKYVAAICHGVSVLAWARVDGVSPLQGRTVVASAGGVPAHRGRGAAYPDAELPLRWQLEWNGATMLTSASVGNPHSTSDDVVVDGRIITAENFEAAGRVAELLAQAVASSPR
jgi:putative intracellular protease/amidase